MTEVPESTDLVVIGGGIIGLSVAYEAARRGSSVLVVEKDRPGGGATPVAAGMLAPVSEAEPSTPELIELGLESCRLYPEFVRSIEQDSGLRCHYETDGTLMVGLDRDDLEELEHAAIAHEQLGLEVERLDARAIRKLEPRLSPRAIGGLRVNADRQVDPRAMSAALFEAILARGGTVLSGWELTALEAGESVEAVLIDEVVGPGDEMVDEGARANRETRGQGHGLGNARVRTSAVVAAAGPWTHQLLPELGSLPLRPVKGQVVRLRGEPLLRHVVRTPDVYLVPRKTGELIVGASVEEQGFDVRPTAGIAMDLLDNAFEALPGVYELELVEVAVGLRPAFRDNAPAIGPMKTPGLYVATGHYRNGIMLAPATARYLVDAIETGTVPAELAPFTADRFATDAPEPDAAAGLQLADARLESTQSESDDSRSRA